MPAVRIDKWLWAARFFKTRTLAAKACELGRVEWNGAAVKPAHDVKVGDRLKVKNESGVFEIEVLGLSEIRGPAPTAQMLYHESDESRAARQQAIEERKAQPHFDFEHEGRPSKRDRRQLSRLRGRT